MTESKIKVRPKCPDCNRKIRRPGHKNKDGQCVNKLRNK